MGVKPEQIKRMWSVADGGELKPSKLWFLENHKDAFTFVSFGDSPVLPDLVDTVVGVELKE